MYDILAVSYGGIFMRNSNSYLLRKEEKGEIAVYRLKITVFTKYGDFFVQTA